MCYYDFNKIVSIFKNSFFYRVKNDAFHTFVWKVHFYKSKN